MKLVSNINYIKSLNIDLFQASIRKDELLYYKYHQVTPFNLLIMVDYSHQELVIEFSSKILLDKYPNLISRDTIKECLLHINRMNICILDMDNILQNSEVVKCDVTSDITYSNINDIVSHVRQNISNYRQWITKTYNKQGITIENTVKTPRYKKRMIIYDKGKELQTAENQSFLNILCDKDKLLQYFKDKVRFELNINTKAQIRNLLNIPNNNLQNVLSSNSNPLLSVIDEAVKYEPQRQRTQTLRDYEHELLLRDCNFDLVKVEAKVRALSSKNTSIKRMMQPYKEIYKHLQNDKTSTIDIRSLVA